MRIEVVELKECFETRSRVVEFEQLQKTVKEIHDKINNINIKFNY